MHIQVSDEYTGYIVLRCSPLPLYAIHLPSVCHLVPALTARSKQQTQPGRCNIDYLRFVDVCA